MSKLDLIYRHLLISKIFTKGWGDPDILESLFRFRPKLACPDQASELVDVNHPITICKEEHHKEYTLIEGHFLSPLAVHLPKIVPTECQTAYFQMVLPHRWHGELKPLCIHLAGTGDHGFWRRKSLLAKPLCRKNSVASIILENPYYGLRKPRQQLRSSLHYVSDLFVMGGALMLECMVLLRWAQSRGFKPLGLTGISMGGWMASLSASSWNQPISLAPCMSWSTASSVFTQGAMSCAIPWKLLQQQYLSNEVYRKQLVTMINPPEECWHEFSAGDQVFPASPGCRSGKSLGLNVFSKMGTKASRGGLQDLGRVKNCLESSTKHLLWGFMDECTHVARFAKPVDTSLIVLVSALHDAYVPRHTTRPLNEIWPNCEIRYTNNGHIASYLFQHNQFRKAIVDSLEKQANKYFQSSIL